MFIRLFFLMISFIFLLSCKKQSDRYCFKNTGSIIEKNIHLPSFSELDLGPYIHYEIVQDTVNFLEISAGENLINFI